MTDLSILRDAVMGRIEVGWEARTAVLEFGAQDYVDVRIDVSGLVRFSLERLEPWGPSEYVYSAELSSDDQGVNTLSIVMGTGDPMMIVAQQFDVKYTEPTA